MAGLSHKAFKFLKNRPVKFMATIGDDGWPNVVPLLSVTPWDKDTLCFVRFMVWKTRKNLEDRKKVAVCALGLTSALEVLGEFEGFEKSGERLDFFNAQPMYRYNAYFGAGQVGVIKVVEDRGWSNAELWRLLQARIMPSSNGTHNCGPEVMPKVVAEKFLRILAAKFISWIDENNWPRLMPAQGAFPIGANKMGGAGCRGLFAKLEPGKPRGFVRSRDRTQLLPGKRKVRGNPDQKRNRFRYNRPGKKLFLHPAPARRTNLSPLTSCHFINRQAGQIAAC